MSQSLTFNAVIRFTARDLEPTLQALGAHLNSHKIAHTMPADMSGPVILEFYEEAV